MCRPNSHIWDDTAKTFARITPRYTLVGGGSPHGNEVE